MLNDDAEIQLGVEVGAGIGIDGVELVGVRGGSWPRSGDTEAGEVAGAGVGAGVSGMNSTAKCLVPIGTGDSCTLNDLASSPLP